MLKLTLLSHHIHLYDWVRVPTYYGIIILPIQVHDVSRAIPKLPNRSLSMLVILIRVSDLFITYIIIKNNYSRCYGFNHFFFIVLYSLITELRKHKNLHEKINYGIWDIIVD